MLISGFSRAVNRVINLFLRVINNQAMQATID